MKNTGFTLVEMMVVIGVLLLLIAVGIPAFHGIVMAVHTHQSQSIINQLEQAVISYQMDSSTTPNSPGGDPNGLPVSNYNDGANAWYGCQWLVLALTGYYYQDSGGKITYGANPSNGYGWKTSRNSQTLGPYNGSETIKVTPGGGNGYTTKSTPPVPPPPDPNGKVYTLTNDADPGSIADCGAKISHPVFLDAFGQAILYYSTNNPTRTYAYRPSGELADNFCADGVHDHDVFGNAYTAGVYYSRQDVYWEQHVHADPGQSGTQSGVYSNLTAMFAPPPSSYYKNASGALYRTDFMLLSWGGDKQWYGAGGSLRDDANNLYGK